MVNSIYGGAPSIFPLRIAHPPLWVIAAAAISTVAAATFLRSLESLGAAARAVVLRVAERALTARGEVVVKNVHDTGSNARTRRALELLRENTGDMADDEIRAAVEEFKSYLDRFKPSSVRQRAQFALDGSGEAEGVTAGAFPPLLGDSTFTINGLSFSGDELIARLWCFGERESNRSEKDLIKTSMVTELSNSFELDGRRICNPGKVEQLVIGVLQGRLAGVSVDDENRPPSAQDAYALFIARPGVRELYARLDLDRDARDRLVAAAELFCNENPLVNREAFLTEIRAL